jgi:hypothetical protein
MRDRSPRIRTFTLLNRVPFGKFNRVNFRYTTAVFTLSPEPWALTCCANLPGDWALYDIPVPRIESEAGLAHSFALRLSSPACRQTGTTPRDDAGLSPHKFTPMPGVHKQIKRTQTTAPLIKSFEILHHINIW